MRHSTSPRGKSRIFIRILVVVFLLWIVLAMMRMKPATPDPRASHPVGANDVVHRRDESGAVTPSPLRKTIVGIELPRPTADGGGGGHAEADTMAPVTTKAAVITSEPSFVRPAHIEEVQNKSSPKTNLDPARRSQVVSALRHSWVGYKSNAFGKDEFLPLSKTSKQWGEGQGIGATMIDALDTLLLAEMTDEADAIIEWVDKKLSFDQDIKVSAFETTIRILGGLISAYQKTGKAPLIRQAADLGKRLAKAFETPSGVPDNYVNLRTGAHEGAGWNGGAAILSELGSLQMEFRALSDITGDKKYDTIAQRAILAIKDHCGNGFCPRNFHGNSPAGSPVGLGSFGDSFYEYLLKYWVLTGKTNTMYGDMWKKAATHIEETSSTIAGHYVPNSGETGGTMEHLACFAGGLFALSYHHTKNEAHLKIAEGIAETCHFMYESMETKLAPDVARVLPNGQLEVHDGKYILRPETVETYFYLWKVTHNPKYRDWGAAVLDACNKHLKVDAGFAGSTDVRRIPTPHNDMMETFWFAETLKYLYLLFSEDELFNLDEWVFNTEAHAFRVGTPSAS
jgi:hypothetical protein